MLTALLWLWLPLFWLYTFGAQYLPVFGLHLFLEREKVREWAQELAFEKESCNGSVGKFFRFLPISMGGYGRYVWGAYGMVIFFVLFVN